MTHRIFFLCMAYWLLSANPLRGQNIVSNGSFEEYLQCPGTFNANPSEFKIPGWFSGNTGTPDHFHICSHGEADVPQNWAGVSYPYEGDGYIGIFLWMENKDYKEYLGNKLVTPLIHDTTYIVEFHYKLSSYSKFSIDRIGILFSHEKNVAAHDGTLSSPQASLMVNDSALTMRTGLWETARWEYKARGGEQFLLIGNFSPNDETKSYKIMSRPVSELMLAHASYYYIDDVKIIPKYNQDLPNATDVIPIFVSQKAKVNETYVLNNIRFEFNSHKLLPVSFEALDEVVAFMVTHPKLKVQLSGHTDDQGSESYNLRLSRNRAASAMQYLITQGIDQKRIETFGYGKQRLLVAGKTEDARKQNRRVEVRFFQ